MMQQVVMLQTVRLIQDIIGQAQVQAQMQVRILLVAKHNVPIKLQGITILIMVERVTIVLIHSVLTGRLVNTGIVTTGRRVQLAVLKLTVPMLNLHRLLIQATAAQAMHALGHVIPVGPYMVLINAARELRA